MKTGYLVGMLDVVTHRIVRYELAPSPFYYGPAGERAIEIMHADASRLDDAYTEIRLRLERQAELNGRSGRWSRDVLSSLTSRSLPLPA